ncbi:MAG: phosphoglycerate kinase [Rhodospirillales bacterium]|jgi:phosphoglycerate kinase|nr:phosphoglycerate kinase [Rhodospirillales bacterium]
MTAFKTLDDLAVAGKRVLVRVDFNVPMKDGRITDATRIERTVPTLTQLADRRARVVVLSHLGRPKGRVVNEVSLGPLAEALGVALGGRAVSFAADCVGSEAERVVAALGDGDVVLLENLRFHAGEEENDRAFAQRLAALGDFYVNDAFSCAHRAHASTEALAHLLPGAAGRLMQAELEALENTLEAPHHPLAAVVGGAKVSTKLDVLGNLVQKTDILIVGGGMANTFLHAKGVAIGASLCEHDMAGAANDILARAAAAGCEVVLPTDAVVARSLEAGIDNRVVGIGAVPADAMILDLGPASIDGIIQRLGRCRSLVWNGPLGAFEVAPFDAATNAVARAAAGLTRDGVTLSVAGGGDTVAALVHAGVADDFSYVSTAGGAFLEWLEGKDLPGVAALGAGSGI